MLKEGIILGERYEIMAKIGTGGMADVYKAQDRKLNRLVAVKVMKAEFREDTAFVAKFQKEAQAAAKLAHPNVVNVYDVGEDRGLYYIVMELVEGITLKNYILKKGKLSVKEATSIAIQVSLGLEAAHNRGIIHRDVKPQNIIISTDGKVKLSDFGIAKAMNSNTITANVMGSVHYSSPEQVRGGNSDAKSDIYSLGITMYEMVTGRVPFDGDSTVSIAIKHLQEEMVPPSRYTPDLPYSLEQIIFKCTQKNPERRYQNVGDLIDDLKHSLIDPQGSFVGVAPLSEHTSSGNTAKKETRSRGGSGSRTSSGGRSGASGGRSSSSGSRSGASGGRSSSSGSRSGASGGRSASGSGRSTSGGSRQGGSAQDRRRMSREEELRRERERRDRERRRLSYEEDDDLEDDEEESGLEKAITIGGFLIGAVIIIILIAVVGNMAGLFNFGRKKTTAATSSASAAVSEVTQDVSSQSTQVEVPSLLGLTVDQATSEANNRGIGVKQTGTAASEEFEEGRIISQSVDAGTLVNPQTTIEVVVSSGKADVTVPVGLNGAAQTDAEAALEAVGLSPNIVLQFSDIVNIGNVISSDPAEGTAVSAGSTVTIYVSKGPDETSTGGSVVPDLAGWQSADATAKLDSLGLAYQTVDAQNEGYADGVVLSVSPAVGSPIEPGEVITLTVNRLPEHETRYVCYSPLQAPDGYNGGQVRLELVQGENTIVLFEGPNPWANGLYSAPIVSQIGDPGEINVYEDDILIAKYPGVTFTAE